MLAFITEQLKNWGIPVNLKIFLSYLLFSAAVLAIGIAIELFFRWVIIGLSYYISRKNVHPVTTSLKKSKLFPRLIHLITPIIISVFASDFGGKAETWILRAVTAYFITVIILVFDSALSVVDDMYRLHEVSKKRPIKGFLQIIELIVVIVCATVVIASWIGESPIVLLSGIGAFAAVATLIFKDTLLGFVAGIQLSANDLVRIGDWIEMPKYSVDGTIKDISLIHVTVENGDNTITTVPAYALVTDSFKNWRPMKKAGSRRIQRAVRIDLGSICFCTDDMLDHFSRIEGLGGFIRSSRKNLSAGAKTQGKPTNIGVFRVYLEQYLSRHPKICEDMAIAVRELASDGHGLPLEITAYVCETEWIPYERICSEICEHMIAIAPSFNLRVFQDPTCTDRHI